MDAPTCNLADLQINQGYGPLQFEESNVRTPLSASFRINSYCVSSPCLPQCGQSSSIGDNNNNHLPQNFPLNHNHTDLVKQELHPPLLQDSEPSSIPRSSPKSSFLQTPAGNIRPMTLSSFRMTPGQAAGTVANEANSPTTMNSGAKAQKRPAPSISLSSPTFQMKSEFGDIDQRPIRLPVTKLMPKGRSKAMVAGTDKHIDPQLRELINAMRDMTNTEDNQGMLVTWSKIMKSKAAKVERVCAELLVCQIPGALSRRVRTMLI